MSVVAANQELGLAMAAGGALLDPASGDDHVVKAEIGSRGVIHLELHSGGENRWCQWRKGALRPIDPGKDRKIPLLRRLTEESFARKARVLAYRPGKRVTLLDGSHVKPRILKGFRPGRLDTMIRHYEIAHQAFTGRGVHAPEIIEYDPEHEALAMVRLDGDRLQLSSDNAELFRLAGEALRDFQACTAADEMAGFGPDDELAVIDKRAGRLAGAGCAAPAGWKQLRTRLDQARAGLPEPRWGLAHRDLHDRQFVQESHYLGLLDFDLMARADTALDPGNFLAHLVLRQMQEVRGANRNSVHICGRNFLEGLDRNRDPGFWLRLRFYQATTFCRLALVYQVRPRWLGLVPQLVTMGGRCLDDLQRIEGGG